MTKKNYAMTMILKLAEEKENSKEFSSFASFKAFLF